MTGIICVNKPDGITSFGVVAKVRGITGEKKIGHTGTLDPMATGVLPLTLGGATKFLDYFPDSDKSYIAKFKLGITTDTLDITGEILAENEVNVTEDDVLSKLDLFKGEIEQVPPMFSAKSVGGVRLYDLARQGKTVERKPCKVVIKDIELTGCDEGNNVYTIKVDCSKGTYIRSLIDDIGKTLGCGAVMTELVRSSAMGFTLDDCVTLDDLQKIKDNNSDFNNIIIDIDKAFSDLKKIYVSSAQTVRFKNGGALDIKRLKMSVDKDEKCAVYGSENEFLGLGQECDGELKVLRILSVRN